MRKLTTALAGLIVLAAAGFASASIVSGGRIVAALTGSTTTSATTGTTPVGRKVTICHRTGSKKNSWHTITVDQHAVPAHLRHGDHLGACTGNDALTSKKSRAKLHRRHTRNKLGVTGPTGPSGAGPHAGGGNPGKGRGGGTGGNSGAGNGHGGGNGGGNGKRK